MLRVSIIGCGKVAKSMAYLWYQSGSVDIIDVVNRTQFSAEESVTFIGAGIACSTYEQLQPADIFVIGCGDDQIDFCLSQLLKQNTVKENNIVFHFSGAKNSTVLNKVKKFGGKCASLHPVKSFAKPEMAIITFENTYCGLEGDKTACETLTALVEGIGGYCFSVDGDRKLTYHAASVFACNYMVALQELSLRAYEFSGIDRELGMKILEPIVKETADNIFKMGTLDALTGPIERGDNKLVNDQYLAVKEWDDDASELYRLLGKLSVELSKQKGLCEKQALESISSLFK